MAERRIETLMEKLSEVEGIYNVSNWCFMDIHIWPLIKHVYFFDFKNAEEKTGLPKNLIHILETFRKKLKDRLSLIQTRNRNLLLSQIPQSDVLFAGANTYYVLWNGKQRNKFFDSIMDDIQFSSIYFNYSPFDLQNRYRTDRTHNIFSLLKNIPIDKVEIDIEGTLEDFFSTNIELGNIVDSFSSTFGFSKQDLLLYLKSRIQSVLYWKNVWLKVLEKVKPKLAIVLCYYDINMYGLILALKDKGIPSVDMQHGGQGKGHPAYSYANNIKGSLNLLPDYFWVWEESAAENILNWSNGTAHNVLIGGNPWIRIFLENEYNEGVFLNKKYVLCTLPADKLYYRLMPEALLNAIIESDEQYIFGFRFHPKTTQAGKKMIKRLITENNLNHKVDFYESNEKPLPYLLSKAWAHISVGSIGSIAEAAIMGVYRNIILDSIGVKYYAKLIEQKKAYYFDIDGGHNLMLFINNISFIDSQSKHKYMPYKDIICNLINLN